jgi:hypothetical protein
MMNEKQCMENLEIIVPSGAPVPDYMKVRPADGTIDGFSLSRANQGCGCGKTVESCNIAGGIVSSEIDGDLSCKFDASKSSCFPVFKE